MLRYCLTLGIRSYDKSGKIPKTIVNYKISKFDNLTELILVLNRYRKSDIYNIEIKDMSCDWVLLDFKFNPCQMKNDNDFEKIEKKRLYSGDLFGGIF